MLNVFLFVFFLLKKIYTNVFTLQFKSNHGGRSGCTEPFSKLSNTATHTFQPGVIGPGLTSEIWRHFYRDD